MNLVLRIMEAYSSGDYTAVPSGTYGGTSFSSASSYSSAIDQSYKVAKERKARQKAAKQRGSSAAASGGSTSSGCGSTGRQAAPGGTGSVPGTDGGGTAAGGGGDAVGGTTAVKKP